MKTKFFGAALSQIQIFSPKDADPRLCTSLEAHALALMMPKLLQYSSLAVWLDVLIDI